MTVLLLNLFIASKITRVYILLPISVREAGTAICKFKVSGMQPELWDPVTGAMRTLPEFKDKNGTTSLHIVFDKA